MNDNVADIYLSLLALAALAFGQQGASPKIGPFWGAGSGVKAENQPLECDCS